MALQSSGAISLSEIRTEFVGGSSAISLGDLYRGGSNVRANASNNNSTNLAAQVPASGAIAFNQFYSQAKGFSYTESVDRTNWSPTVFGDDLNVNYPKTYTLPSGRTITNSALNGIAFNVPSGAQSLTLTINGIIRTYSGYALRNQSSSTVTVNGSGSIRKNNKDGFNSTFTGNGSAEMPGSAGGFGGASGPDLWHSDYGNSGIDCKVTRSGNTFTASWTYNECDYANLGAGSYNITSIFPLNSDGTFNDGDTGTYVINATAGGNGRDVRDIAWGSKIVSGVRHFWFGSNNKAQWPTEMDLNSMTYYQSGHASTALNTGNSRRSVFISTYTGNHTTGSFSISGPSQTTG